MKTKNLNKIVHELINKFNEATSLNNKNHLKFSIFYLDENNNVMFTFNEENLPQNSKKIMLYTLPEVLTPDRNFSSKFYNISYKHKFNIFKTILFYSLCDQKQKL